MLWNPDPLSEVHGEDGQLLKLEFEGVLDVLDVGAGLVQAVAVFFQNVEFLAKKLHLLL